MQTRTRHRTRSGACAVVALAGCLVLAGCAGGRRGGEPGRVTVLAAASLAGTVEQLGHEYERAHPGTSVAVTAGGSSDLVRQLAGGLHADLLVTADERTMASAREQHLVESPTRIAHNTLTLVTAPGNPLDIRSLTDADEHVLVVCAPPVPCGAAARRLAARTGETIRARSEESNVTAVLEKVRSGQADAGVVYRTDARRAGRTVTAVPLRGAAQVRAAPMAAVTSESSADGRGVLALLTGPRGRAVLARAGFDAP